MESAAILVPRRGPRIGAHLRLREPLRPRSMQGIRPTAWDLGRIQHGPARRDAGPTSAGIRVLRRASPAWYERAPWAAWDSLLS